LTVAAYAKGENGLSIWDDQRKGRAQLQVNAVGHSKLSLYDARETARISMDVAPDGTREVSFPGEARHP
jgi:hypothetical protein